MNITENPFVPNVHFEQIRIRDLVSNQTYQRNISVKHVNKTTDHFDVYQVNPVKVSRRDGINYVFNGQHTIETIAKASGSRDTPVWCMIYDDLNYEHEADIFANQQKYVKPLSPYDTFNANVEAGNNKQLLIKSLIESYDLRITASRVPNGISAVASLENIYDKYGFEHLANVISLIIDTWNGAPLSLSANMLNGVAKLLYVYDGFLKRDYFIEKCGTISVKEISRLASERKAGSLGFAEALIIFYNKRCRTPLPFERLYSRANNVIRPDRLKNRNQNEEQESEDPAQEEAPVIAYAG